MVAPQLLVLIRSEPVPRDDAAGIPGEEDAGFGAFIHAEIGALDDAAEHVLQLLGEMPRDFGRGREIMVLRLAYPAEATAKRNAGTGQGDLVI